MSVQIPIGDSELQRVVDAIVSRFSPTLLMLFGSAARGDVRASSDYDLMVVMPDGTDRRRTAQAIYRVLADVRGRSRGVDIVVVTEGEFARGRDDLGTIVRVVHQEGRDLFRGAAAAVD